MSILDPKPPTRAELTATYLDKVGAAAKYSPITVASPRRSPSVVFLGDSLTQIGTDVAARKYGNSLASLVAAMSNGRILLTENAGIASNTVPMMADRLQTDVISKNPGRCFILAGSNSTTKGYAHFDTARSDYENRIILPLLAAGIEPILATIPPRDFSRTSATATNTGPAVYQLTLAWNVFVRSMAAKYRLPLVDIYMAVTDPNTGNYYAGYNDDGVHWNYLGVYIAAKFVADALASYFPVVATPLDKDRYSIINFCQDPVFLGGVGNGTEARYPLGFNGSNTADLATVSIINPTTGDGLEAGKWLRIGKTGGSNSTNVNMIRTLADFTAKSGVAVNVGDRIALGFRYSLTEPTGGGYATVSLNFRGSGGSSDIKKTITPINQWAKASSGVIWIEDTVPSGTVDLRLDFSFGAAGTIQMDVGQVSVYNLTSMGMPSLLSVGQAIPTTAALVAPPEPPPAPAQVTGLTAGSATTTTQALSWTAVSGATSYSVQYRVTGSGTWLNGPTPTGAGTTVTGLTANTSYEYRVAGINTTGTGTYSATLTASTPATDPVPVMITSDSFNRADTAAGSLGTSDAAYGGTAKAWTTSGQVQILSNQVGATTLTTTRFSYLDAGAANHRVRAKITAVEGGVIARVTDTNNYYSVRYDAATDKVLIEKRVASVTTTLWTSGTGVFTVGGTLGISVQGTAVIALVNGTEINRVTDTSLTTGNLCGMRSSFNNPAFRMDDLYVWDF